MWGKSLKKETFTKFLVPILTNNWMCHNRIKPSFHHAAPVIVLISYNQVPISLFIEIIETSQRNQQKQPFACRIGQVNIALEVSWEKRWGTKELNFFFVIGWVLLCSSSFSFNVSLLLDTGCLSVPSQHPQLCELMEFELGHLCFEVQTTAFAAAAGPAEMHRGLSQVHTSHVSWIPD